MKKPKHLLYTLILSFSLFSFTHAESFIYLKDKNGVLQGIIKYDPTFVNKYIKTNIVCLSKKLEGMYCEYVDDASPVAKSPGQTLQVSISTPLANVDALKKSIADLDARVKVVEKKNNIPTTVNVQNLQATTTSLVTQVTSGGGNFTGAPILSPQNSEQQVVYQVIERAVPGPQGPAGRDGKDGISYGSAPVTYAVGAEYNGVVDPNTLRSGASANLTDLTISTISGAGLSSCNATTSKLVYNASTKLFECASDQQGGGSSSFSGGDLTATGTVLTRFLTATGTSNLQTTYISTLYASTTNASTTNTNNLSAALGTITNATATNLYSTSASLSQATTTNLFATIFTALSSVITNLIGTNATITNSTTTNSFATTASSTNLYSTNASFGILSAVSSFFTTLFGTTGNFATLNASTTNATSSNISNLYASSTLENSASIGVLTSTTSTSLSSTTAQGRFIAGSIISTSTLQVNGSSTLASTTVTNLTGTTIAGNTVNANTGNLNTINSTNITNSGSSTLASTTISNATVNNLAATTLNGNTANLNTINSTNITNSGSSTLASTTVTNLTGQNISGSFISALSSFFNSLFATTGYFTTLNATTTNATTTNTQNLFATGSSTLASTTLANITTQNIGAQQVNASNISTTNITGTNATFTNLSVNGPISTTNVTTSGLTATGSSVLASTSISKLTLDPIASGTTANPLLVRDPLTGEVKQISASDLLASNTTNTISFATNTNQLTSTVNGVIATTSISELNGVKLNGTTTTQNINNSGNILTNLISAVTGYFTNLFFTNATGTNLTLANLIATGTINVNNILGNNATFTSLDVTNLSQNTVNAIASNTTNNISYATSTNVLTSIVNGKVATTSILSSTPIIAGNGINVSTTSTSTTIGLSPNATFTTLAVTGTTTITGIFDIVGTAWDSLWAKITASTTNTIAMSTSTNVLTSTVNGKVATTTVASSGNNSSSTIATLSQVITNTSGTNLTYTPSTDTAYVVVEVWGAGGGGGASNVSDSNDAGFGGGGGGYSQKTISSPSGTYYYTIGSGGNGGVFSGGFGSAGQDTCFGTNSSACTSPIVKATGGGGGGSGGSNTSGNGGLGYFGDINLQGQNGISGAPTFSTNFWTGGQGGSAPRGGAGGAVTTGAGSQGRPYGGGGSGSGQANGSGGNGGSGGEGGIAIYVYKNSNTASSVTNSLLYSTSTGILSSIVSSTTATTSLLGGFGQFSTLAVATSSVGAGKVATFLGDIDVTGTIDPTRILFTNLAGVNSPSYNPSANSNNYSVRFEEGGNLNFQSNTTNNILHLANNGNVAVGTQIPNKSLSNRAFTVNGTNAGDYAALELSSGDVGRFFINATQGATYINNSDNTSFLSTYVGGSERMRILPGGNVGIGLTNPGSKLSVYGGDINLQEQTAGRKIGFGVDGAGSFTSPSGVSTGYYGLTYGSGGTFDVGLSGYDNLQMYTLGAERMRITNTGNVGIGTTSPALRFAVTGSQTYRGLTSSILIDSTTPGIQFSGSTGFGSGIISNSGDLKFYTRTSSGDFVTTDEIMTMTSNGLGISTSSPILPLSIAAVGSYRGQTNTIALSGSAPGIVFNDNTADEYTSIQSDGGAIKFFSRTTAGNISATLDEKMRVHSNGNIGIGTTTPASKLQVRGTVCLDLNSDNVCTDNTSAISDARLKTNLATITDALSLVDKLKPVYFNWQTNSELPTALVGNARSLGFMAQDVESIFPGLDLVSTTSDGYKVLDYSKLTAVLAASIKELYTLVKNMAEEIVTKKLKTEMLCIGAKCVNEEQFGNMMGGKPASGISVPNGNSSGGGGTWQGGEIGGGNSNGGQTTGENTTGQINITLNGSSPETIASTTTSYVDPGATATDELGTNISVTSDASVVLSNIVPGTYNITYTATSATSTKTLIRQVIVTE